MEGTRREDFAATLTVMIATPDLCNQEMLGRIPLVALRLALLSRRYPPHPS